MSTPDIVEQIRRAVCDHLNVRPADLVSPRCQDQRTCYARHVAMYLVRELTPLSLPKIGRRFAGRDHTTVFYAVRKVADLIGSDPTTRQTVQALRDHLSGPTIRAELPA